MLRPDRTEALHYEILLIKVRYGLLEPESMRAERLEPKQQH